MKKKSDVPLIELEVDTYDAFDYTSKIIGKHSLEELKEMLHSEIDQIHAESINRDKNSKGIQLINPQ